MSELQLQSSGLGVHIPWVALGAELCPQAMLGHLALPLKVTFQGPLPPPVHICLAHLKLCLGIVLGWLHFSHLLMVFFVFFTVLE